MADNGVASPRSRKRSREADAAEEDVESKARDTSKDDGSSSDDDDFGPVLPSSAPPKKKRKLPYEKVYISALPGSPRYSKSLMHKEQLSFVTMTPFTDFLVTASVDGSVKFWKKVAQVFEFVKQFKAHEGEVTSISVSSDGRSLATAGVDGTIKLFDVVSFDLLTMLEPGAIPRSICWVHKRGASTPLLAVAEDSASAIKIFDGRGESQTPLEALNIHKSPVIAMAYNNAYDCAISADQGGMIEYWRPTGTHERPETTFQYKSSTSLFDLKKSKARPSSISISPNGSQFATFSFPDRRVRVFDFATGKLYRTYDESIQTLTDMQQAGTALQKLDDLEFGRRLATERDIESSDQGRVNVIFDESSNFIIYGSYLGAKVINTLTNRVVRVYGKDESLRLLHLALYQGAPQKKSVVTAQMAASSNPLLEEAEERDPVLIATAHNKLRFYMFTNETEIIKATRDVQNEKPRELNQRKALAPKVARLGSAATIHTSMGDIHLRLFPQAAPKAVENFATHSRNGYYNNTIFHRVIRKFMIQCGDPLGDGTGGESIWGRDFEDEFGSLRHDKPYTVSMANAGPATNASQFFITTVAPAPWLDDKHTIFGRVDRGMEVVHAIENVRVWKEKPEVDIKILSISVE